MISGRKKKAAVWMLVIALLIMLAASEFLIVRSADHRCTGEDCLICRAVRTVSEMSVFLLAAITASVAAAAVGRCVRPVRFKYRRISDPVSLCVKLTE